LSAETHQYHPSNVRQRHLQRAPGGVSHHDLVQPPQHGHPFAQRTFGPLPASLVTFLTIARGRARLVVGAFGAMRVGIGVAFALAPDRLAGRSDTKRSDTLMTRSFAVREVVLGVGALMAVRQVETSPSAIRTWAGLGALTDGGDLATSLAGVRRREPSARLSAVVAAVGLVAELWALGGASQ
jgi:hypothetical protein